MLDFMRRWWVRQLNSGNDEAQKKAAAKLARSKDSRSLQALVAALQQTQDRQAATTLAGNKARTV
jgi:hypothetical protein